MRTDFRILLILHLSVVSTSSYSQNKQSEEVPAGYRNELETIASEGANTETDTDFLELLSEYKKHPLNLNACSMQELELFPLMTSLQSIALLTHREKFGSFLSIEELQVIDEFSIEEIRRLSEYISFGNESSGLQPSFKNLLTKSEQSLALRYQETKSGKPESENSYFGPAYKLFTRYKYRFGNKFRFSLTGEKDPGEGFFSSKQKKGFDYSSGYLEIQRSGVLQKIVVGDYSCQFGQGLVLWSGFGFGKSSETVLIKKNGRGIIPSSSTDENNFFRGIAFRSVYKKISADLFLSTHKVDGNSVESDTGKYISSFQNTGYHRNPSEWEDKHSLREQVAGVSVNYSGRSLNTGAVVYATRFSLPFIPSGDPYTRFDFYKNNNLNGGVNYSYIYRNINLFGEIGISKSGGKAVLQGILAQLHARLSVALLFRSYDVDYHALKAHGFSENTRTANETGWYTGFNWKMSHGVTLTGYADVFRFPWLRYQVDAPSSGSGNYMQCSWQPKKTMEMYVRYRVEKKEESHSRPEFHLKPISQNRQQNLRWNLRFDLDATWEWSSRFEYIRTKKGPFKASYGYAAYQELFFHPLKSFISGSVRYSIFNCPAYDARIFAYENDVLYSFSVPAAYGSGTRYYVNLRFKVFRQLNVWAKYSSTTYMKSPVYSAEAETPSPKSEYKIQIIYQL
ncbi:MAG TPA: hypothetical protein PLU53_11750 [Bacteroidia bacterium]|nr:hypothetical protein [Bacteroidia bacterium]